MTEPVICIGQQPCGIFPKRFLQAKVARARDLQAEIGGRIVFFFHDSDHDYRETVTLQRDRRTGALERLNFQAVNQIQKKYSPLYAKRIRDGWQEETARRLPRFIEGRWVEEFRRVQARTVACFCLELYRRIGLLDGIEVVRSSDPAVREAACPVEDRFVDVDYQGELVRARCTPDGLRLHRGGGRYHDLGVLPYRKSQISPTRDTRLVWMQSVVRCTHYVAGAGEMLYLDRRDCPEIEYVARYQVEEADHAWVP